MTSTPTVQGAQVVGRVALLLRLVGSHPRGATMTQLVHDSELTRPTVHRLLSSLAAEGLLLLDTATATWHYGPEISVMGSLAAERHSIEHRARPTLARLAELTGESAFLSARRGGETVCLLRQEGAFPIRSFVLHEGVRFPLGVASAGLAILAALPDSEVDDILQKRPDVGYGEQHTAARIRDRLVITRETGYAVNPGLVLEGSWGLGAAVFDRAGRPEWALSLTGIEPRFRTRLSSLGRLLRDEADAISATLSVQ